MQLRYIIIIISVMSVISFILFGADKARAVRGDRRIRERTLLLSAALFGAPGALLGMLCFRHKIRKNAFRLLVPVFLAVQIFLLVLYIPRLSV